MLSSGQHQVKDAKKIGKIAQDNPGALVLGSRRFKERVSFRSRFGNTATRLVYQISTGQRVWDTQTGLRTFSSELIPLFLGIHGDASSHFDTVKASWRVYKEILRFSAASLISFLVDYGLYSFLTLWTSELDSMTSILISDLGVRIVSASVNYTINRKLVFQSNVHIARSVGQYALLAMGILAGNTIVLSFLADYLCIDRYVAKLITELLFFWFSWLVQRKIIFWDEKNPNACSGMLKKKR